MMAEMKGNLITLAQEGEFDVIAHGCNCHCTMGAGIAPQMASAFNADKFPMERPEMKGDVRKLGNIDFMAVNSQTGELFSPNAPDNPSFLLYVVNCYTQYGFGSNHEGGTAKPINYPALRLCLQKMNAVFSGMRVGLPWIGCGLAGGDIDLVRQMIAEEMVSCEVTLIEYDRN